MEMQLHVFQNICRHSLYLHIYNAATIRLI